MTEVTSQKENKINIKTQSKFMTMPDKSCLSSKSRSTTGFNTNRASQEEKKIRFEDDTFYRRNEVQSSNFECTSSMLTCSIR